MRLATCSRLVVALVATFVGSACGGVLSASDQCYAALASREMDSTTRSVEALRCDQARSEDRADQRHREDRYDVRMLHNTDHRAENRRAIANVRSAPRVPEVGGTVREAAMICDSQGGITQVDHRTQIRMCRVSGGLLYSFVVDGESTITRVEAYYEGADVHEIVQRGRARLGEPEVTVVAGVRVFTWHTPDLVRSVAVIDRGVRVTSSRREAQPLP